MVYWSDLLACSYLGFELFLLATRRGKVEAKSADRGTIYAVWALIAGGCFAGFLLARRVTVLNWPVKLPIVCLAVMLMVSGTALRIWAVRHLGRLFTVDVGIQQGHQVVEDGPYRFVRHPSYSGSLLALVGVGFLTFNWLGLFLVITGTWLAYALRISVEEKAMLAQFTGLYAEYAARTKRLIPWIY
ncbi:MAG TPA: isoprenylcysteine carboxylmethyltransferase family protein [Chthoniobacterales bacterium]|nr:isoprenylcysteine carboxylmethyltransferase family protein [Chthoniobacterales bacterium]